MQARGLDSSVVHCAVKTHDVREANMVKRTKNIRSLESRDTQEVVTLRRLIWSSERTTCINAEGKLSQT